MAGGHTVVLAEEEAADVRMSSLWLDCHQKLQTVFLGVELFSLAAGWVLPGDWKRVGNKTGKWK